MIYIGVDPGKNGGFAVIADDALCGIEVHLWDDEGYIALMKEMSKYRCIAAVEKVGAMPKQGLSSTFSFGKSAGFIEGVLAALSIPYQLIPPKEWKKLFGLNSDKQKSIDVCKHLYPGVSLLPNERCRKDSDGMAESLLLATYAKRKL